MNVSCCMYEWVISHTSRVNATCHMYEWVISLTSMSYVIYTKEAFTYSMRHVIYRNESRHIHPWVMSHIEWVVSFEADASWNCHKPTQKKRCHQSQPPTQKKKKVYGHIYKYVSEIPGWCVKEPQFSHQKTMVLRHCQTPDIHVYMGTYVNESASSRADASKSRQEHQWLPLTS